MLFISLLIVFLIFMNFSLNSNMLNLNFIWNIFMEIKFISVFLIKIMMSLMIFLIMNYNSYIYLSLGLSMEYGFVFMFSMFLMLFSWVLWMINNWQMMISHFLPQGIEGILKIFIPLLEMVGVIIRPLTLAVRLATNISCGHVVLLMFSYFAFNIANYLVFSISILLFGLYFIEFSVCVIQAYVFWSLYYIYLIEIEI